MLPPISHRQHHIQLLSSVAAVLPDIHRNVADDVVASCDGLLCFLDHRSACSYYVINPITSAQIYVVRPSHCFGCLLEMYFHPSTGEYRLIRRKGIYYSTPIVDVISLNGEAWRTLPSSLPGNFVTFRAPVDLNGFLYWKADDLFLKMSMILRFDIVTEEFKLISIPRRNPFIPTNNNNITDMTSNGLGHLMKYLEQHFPKDDILVKMGNILGLVSIDRERMFLDHMWIEVWIVKNFENAEWENMYSINYFGMILPGFVFGFDSIFVDIAFCIQEEAMMVLLAGIRPFFLKFDLKAKQSQIGQCQMGRYQIVHIVRDVYDWPVLPYNSFLYKESLLSLDSFSNN